MRQQTELMRSILTNETAQRMIDFVSPIYGNSYVGLWLFQAIGVALSDICAISEQLRYETNACTADLLLDYWERQYGLPTDSSLTKEQRRDRIITKKQSRGPCNPERLAAAVSTSLGGAKAAIEENVDQNTFMVHIQDVVMSVAPAVSVVSRRKPAHLIYGIIVDVPYETTADVKTAVNVSYEETYTLDTLNRDADGIYVAYETLYANVDGVSASGETFQIDEGIAATDSGTLIFN